MGASQQKEAANAVEYFAHVVSCDAPPSAGDFAAQLSQHAAVLCGGCQLYAVAEPLVRTLLAHTPRTGRLRWLLYMGCTLFDTAVHNGSAATAEQLAMLRVLELVLRHTHHIVGGRSDVLLRLLSASGDHDNDNNKKNNDDDDGSSYNDNNNNNAEAMTSDVLPWLCQQLMVYTVNVELSNATAATHAAVMCLLLTMTSSALHHDCALRDAYVDIMTEMMMSCSVLRRFLLVLLHRTVRWGSAPSMATAATTSRASLLYAGGQPARLRSMLTWLHTPRDVRSSRGSHTDKAHWLTLATLLREHARDYGKHDDDGNNEDTTHTRTHNSSSCSSNIMFEWSSCAELVSRHSAQLLAVLVAHQKGNGCNPALTYVLAMRDQRPLPFVALLQSLAARLPSCPTLCMLLYVLLHDHGTFLRDTLALDARAVVAVVHSLLQLLYAATTMAATTTNTTADKAEQQQQSQSASLHKAATTTTTTLLTTAMPAATLNALMCDAVRFAVPFVAFMTATLLLVLSQSSHVATLLADAVCSTTPLLPHRYAGRRVSMAALTMVVVDVAVARALRDGDEALADVLVPTLANVAPYVHDMDAVSADCIVAFVAQLVCTVRRLAHELAATATAADDSNSNNSSSSSHDDAAAQRRRDIAEMHLRQLAVVVEALETMVRDGRRNNHTLIYALLYTHEAFVTATRANGSDGTKGNDNHNDNSLLTRLQTVCANCVALIDDYASVLLAPSHTSDVLTADDILARIRCKSRGHCGDDDDDKNNRHKTATTKATATTSKPRDGADANNNDDDNDNSDDSCSDEPTFVYEELPNSYSFFGCFVWATLLSDARYPGGVLWTTDLQRLRLFPRNN